MGQCSCREDWHQEQGCEGCHHQLHGVGRFRIEEEWCLQDWWLLELEAQEKASSPSSQGSQSFHQGAMCVQGQASFQNSPRLGHEEVEGDDQLNDRRSISVSCKLIPVGGRTGFNASYSCSLYNPCFWS